MEKKKIVKFIVLVIAIIVILFVGDLIRKTYIIANYDKKCQEYNNITNFYKKYIGLANSTIEVWRKGNVSLLKITSENEIKMQYTNIDEKVSWMILDRKIGNEENKTAVKMNKENVNNNLLHNVSNQEFGAKNIWQYMQLAFMSNITSKNYDNIKCYEIKKADNSKIYVNKENYLCVREIKDNIDTGLIEYRLNDVTDEEVKVPDLKDFKIQY